MGLLARFTERRDVSWPRPAASATAARSRAPQAVRTEVETCGLCHGRRGQLSESWVPGRPLSDTHQVSALGRGLYQPDGQMIDEVYNYGSFKQSKMFAAGVTCSDCHEPHSSQAARRHRRHLPAMPRAGQVRCARAPPPRARRSGADLRLLPHAASAPTWGSTGATTTAFASRARISRPASAPRTPATTVTPTRRPSGRRRRSKRWHGPERKGFQTYAGAFHAAWNGGAEAARLLGEIAADGKVPAIARASALAELAPYLSPVNLELARAGLGDPDPMVRIGAIEMLDGAPANRLWPLLSPLLSDPVGGVRIRAVALLANVPAAEQPDADRGRFDRAAAEFVAAQRLNADRPEARTTLGSFLARTGRAAEAEAEYRAALRLGPTFAPAAVNLADLYRQLGRDADGVAVLRAALVASAGNAELHHALGLALIRAKQPDNALAELRRAAALEPERARYAYVYAVALHSAGRAGEALKVLKEALVRHPNDRDLLTARSNFSRDVETPRRVK